MLKTTLEFSASASVHSSLHDIEHAVKAARDNPEEIREKHGQHEQRSCWGLQINWRNQTKPNLQTGHADGRTRTADLRVMNPAL